MGGQSHGNFSIVGNAGVFQGSVKNVSFLHAPGFCKFESEPLQITEDAAKYLAGGVQLKVRANVGYSGFKLAITAIGASTHHGGHEVYGSYKASFGLFPSDDFTIISLPFSKMSSDWSDFTGDCHTKDPDGYQHECCTPATPKVCPSAATLAKIVGFSIWAEGVEGDFHLEVESITAVGPAAF
jgi:hypothetical protein|tara:strand:+ start:429 stop:977 length:549 start_codon:yes stop_codon:yes gene_type:complete